MELVLRLASAEDAPVIWKMQKIAFRELLERYQDYDISPVNQSLDQLRLRCSQKDRYYYFINVDENPVGVLSVTDMQDGSRKRLSPMFILPQFQGRGYAQEAMKQAEKIHGERGWELDTILQEERLVHLYEKMGYQKTGKTAAVNPRMTLVFYQKL
ncbi:GNAT family N-acetyltransferase [Holdemania filiformis]|nr:GNAT family N-acetyltransferase [Holdemania filiformis]